MRGVSRSKPARRWVARPRFQCAPTESNSRAIPSSSPPRRPLSNRLPADGRFLKACRRAPVDATPVWFMRQAGRYMAEYRALRARHSILDLCHTPDLAAEVTLQPIRRFDLDAAILFADILLPFEPLGLGLSFAQGAGPVIARPIRDAAAVAALPPVDPQEHLGYVLQTVRQVRAELPPQTALIGFAGAPFTLASYAIEGGASRDFARTK